MAVKKNCANIGQNNTLSILFFQGFLKGLRPFDPQIRYGRQKSNIPHFFLEKDPIFTLPSVPFKLVHPKSSHVQPPTPTPTAAPKTIQPPVHAFFRTPTDFFAPTSC